MVGSLYYTVGMVGEALITKVIIFVYLEHDCTVDRLQSINVGLETYVLRRFVSRQIRE